MKKLAKFYGTFLFKCAFVGIGLVCAKLYFDDAVTMVDLEELEEMDED